MGINQTIYFGLSYFNGCYFLMAIKKTLSMYTILGFSCSLFKMLILMCYLMAIISKTVLMAIIITHGSHKNLRKKFHDFSMTSPGQNPNFQMKKKYQYLFLQPMYQIVESITERHRRTLTHRHTHDLIKANRLFN